jgi:hypothetical protein
MNTQSSLGTMWAWLRTRVELSPQTIHLHPSRWSIPVSNTGYLGDGAFGVREWRALKKVECYRGPRHDGELEGGNRDVKASGIAFEFVGRIIHVSPSFIYFHCVCQAMKYRQSTAISGGCRLLALTGLALPLSE